MDPIATLMSVERNITAGTYRVALDYLLAYYQWRVRGGLEPTDGDAIAERFAHQIQDGLEQAY
jgi:hypothetical protein